MKTGIISSRIIGNNVLVFCLFALLFVTTESFAQTKTTPPTPKCAQQTVGYIDNKVILWTKATRQNPKEVKEIMECLKPKFDQPIICYGAGGNAIESVASQPTGKRTASTKKKKPVIKVNLLAGQNNCKLMSIADKVMIPDGETLMIGYPCQCKKAEDCKCAGKAGCDCDCSCENQERWNFIAVDADDDSKGFYIVTREDNPRAVLRSGVNVMLRTMGTMDGKMREMAQWNFFMAGRNKDGSTRFLFRAQDGFDKVLAPDSRSGRLQMVEHNFDEMIKNPSKPGAKRDWKCECLL